MHPLIAAAAATWGVPAGDLAARVAAVSLLPARPPRQIEAFVRDYYRRRALPPGFTFYDRGGRSPAVIWRSPDGVVRREQTVLVPPPARLLAVAVEAAVPCLRRLTNSAAQLWDDEILRLLAFDFASGLAHAEFSVGRFFDYRLRTGLLTEEAANGACELRDSIMPTMAAFDERFTAGGLQALVAIARPAPYDDFAIPLQIRGRTVSDGQGLYGVIPMAYHQPIRRDGLVDARGISSALRELAEELCGLEEGGLDFEALPAVAEMRRRAILEITGFTLNLVNGNYDYNILICHPDPSYWDNYARHWSPNWEAERALILSSRDHGAFHRLITHEDWVPQSLVSLMEGLDRLRAIDPSRCTWPGM